MPERLPIFVDPENAAGRGLHTSGALSLAKMACLSDRLVEPYGEVWVDLVFAKNGQRLTLNGNIKGHMYLECQRCLEAMKVDVNHKFELGLIKSEAEIEALLPDQEPLMIGHEELRVADIIEDELELLLPMVVLHDLDQCKVKVQSEPETKPEPETQAEKQTVKNPFSVLADLKK